MEKLVLSGHGVRLEPLEKRHAHDLSGLVDAGMWHGMTVPLPDTADAMVAHLERLAAGGAVAFAVVDATAGTVAGVTAFYDVAHDVGRVEIGHTFYGRRWWGTHVNPAAKLLLLSQAFDVWGMERVALRADVRNTRSLAAIRRLGAQPEGVLRSHRVAFDGTRSDTAYFSILRSEWPAARAGLTARLAELDAPTAPTVPVRYVPQGEAAAR